MITPHELAILMPSTIPHAVLDLRERGAYERGHVFRATSLPRRLLELRLPELVTARATPLVVYDDDGSLVEKAGPTLAAMGYTDVRPLAGGLGGWRAAGRPTVQGVNVPSKVFGERALQNLKTPQVAPHELQERMRAGADMVIVDARTPEEYARGCIPGAWSVPGGELVLRIGDLVSRPETTVVVHCGGRTRSYIGAESLRRMRLPNPVVALENGTMGWELAGLPLERGASRWAPPVSTRSRLAAAVVAKRVAVEDGVRFVTAADLRALRERRDRQNVHVLDVRTLDEYRAGHIPGAIWAPGGQVVQATDDYLAVRAGSIVLVCDGLVRSTLTASWLGRMGYPDVAALAGGMPAWVSADGPVEEGQPVATPFGWAEARAAVPRVPPAPIEGATSINVDPSDVYARGHVPGAAWICRSRLEMRIEQAAPDRRTPIVVSCIDGQASTLAAATLLALSYAGVRVLDGGTRAWEAVGQPVERGATRLLDDADDVVPKPYERGRAAMEAYLRWEEALDQEGGSPHALLPGLTRSGEPG
jgi:rhodanese-related sulfurtransferase